MFECEVGLGRKKANEKCSQFFALIIFFLNKKKNQF